MWRRQLKTCWCCNCCWWGSCWQQFVADFEAKLLFRAQGLVKILKLKFRQDLQLEFGQFFFCWCFVEVMKLNLGRDFEARFEQVLWRGWCLVEILKLMYSRDSEDEIWSRFVFELVIWTQPSGPLCLWQCLFSVSAWSLLFILITTSTPHSRFCHLDNSYSFFVRQITISWTHLHLRTNRC